MTSYLDIQQSGQPNLHQLVSQVHKSKFTARVRVTMHIMVKGFATQYYRQLLKMT